LQSNPIKGPDSQRGGATNVHPQLIRTAAAQWGDLRPPERYYMTES
jgi:hypothetical protein